MSNYLFTSNRLGFRNWKTTDVDLLSQINADKKVMQFFPSTPTKKATEDFILRMQEQFSKKQFCYFAVELLNTQQFIGFIGLSEQTYESEFNPSIDIGWRLAKEFWHKGYATEGAKACLAYGFHQLKLDTIISVAPIINIPSISVMQKIGMQKVYEFKHPFLLDYPKLVTCVFYEIRNK